MEYKVMVTFNTQSSLWGRNPGERQQIAAEIISMFGGVTVSRKQVIQFLSSTGRNINAVSWLLNNKTFRVSRGNYTLQPLVMPNGSGVGTTPVSSGV
jgi:hypothetical protein